MDERELTREFVKQWNLTGTVWAYKIPDTYGGHKKPGDIVALWPGGGALIEMKMDGGTVLPHQHAALNAVGGKGFPYVGEFIPWGDTNRTILFRPYKQGHYDWPGFHIIWYKGRYLGLKKLPELFRIKYEG